MSTAGIYAGVDAICRLAQKCSVNPYELRRLRDGIRKEVTKLSRETERNKESTKMIVWRDREQTKIRREQEMQQLKETRMLEQQLLTLRNQVAQLTVERDQARQNTELLARENERYVNYFKELEASEPEPIVKHHSVHHYQSPSHLPRDPSEYPVASPPKHYLSNHHQVNEMNDPSWTNQHDLMSEHDYGDDEDDDDTASVTSSAFLGDTPRSFISEKEIKRAVKLQADKDLGAYFWSRCNYQCSCNHRGDGSSCGNYCLEGDTASDTESEGGHFGFCQIPGDELLEMTTPGEDDLDLTYNQVPRPTDPQGDFMERIQEVEDMRGEVDQALEAIKECLRCNRSNIRDARRDLVRLQGSVTAEQMRLERIQQTARSTGDSSPRLMDQLSICQDRLEAAIEQKNGVDDLLKSLREEDQLLREQKIEMESRLCDLDNEIAGLQKNYGFM